MLCKQWNKDKDQKETQDGVLCHPGGGSGWKNWEEGGLHLHLKTGMNLNFYFKKKGGGREGQREGKRINSGLRTECPTKSWTNNKHMSEPHEE